MDTIQPTSLWSYCLVLLLTCTFLTPTIQQFQHIDNRPPEVTSTRLLVEKDHFYTGKSHNVCQFHFKIQDFYDSVTITLNYLEKLKDTLDDTLTYLSQGLHPEQQRGSPFMYRNQLYAIINTEGPAYSYNECDELNAKLVTPTDQKEINYYKDLLKIYNEEKESNYTHYYVIINTVKYKNEDGTDEFVLQHLYGQNQDVNIGVIRNNNQNYARINLQSGDTEFTGQSGSEETATICEYNLPFLIQEAEHIKNDLNSISGTISKQKERLGMMDKDFKQELNAMRAFTYNHLTPGDTPIIFPSINLKKEGEVITKTDLTKCDDQQYESYLTQLLTALHKIETYFHETYGNQLIDHIADAFEMHCKKHIRLANNGNVKSLWTKNKETPAKLQWDNNNKILSITKNIFDIKEENKVIHYTVVPIPFKAKYTWLEHKSTGSILWLPGQELCSFSEWPGKQCHPKSHCDLSTPINDKCCKGILFNKIPDIASTCTFTNADTSKSIIQRVVGRANPTYIWATPKSVNITVSCSKDTSRISQKEYHIISPSIIASNCDIASSRHKIVGKISLEHQTKIEKLSELYPLKELAGLSTTTTISDSLENLKLDSTFYYLYVLSVPVTLAMIMIVFIINCVYRCFKNRRKDQRRQADPPAKSLYSISSTLHTPHNHRYFQGSSAPPPPPSYISA